MASGFEPDEIYVRLLALSLRAIRASGRSGERLNDQEHLASSVATTLIGRSGPRFVHPGRKKGVVTSRCRPASVTDSASPGSAISLPTRDTRASTLAPTRRLLPRRCDARCGTSGGGRRQCRRHRASSGRRTPPCRCPSGTTVGAAPGRRKRDPGRTDGARSRCGRVGRGSARARDLIERCGPSVVIPLPLPSQVCRSMWRLPPA